MRLLVLLIGFAAPVAWACTQAGQEDDPLASLTEAERSPKYDASFWEHEAEAKSATWKKAVALCQDEASANRPNCAVVLSRALIQGLEEAAREPFLEYGAGQGSTGVPEGFEDAVSALVPAQEDSETDERSNDAESER